VLEDFVDPIMRQRNKKLSDNTRSWIAIATVIIFGALTVGLSFAADKFTSKLIQAAGTIWGVFGGPLAGIFIMGFFFPFCNSWGAISGMFGGLFLGLWVSIGSIVHSPDPDTLPIGLCNNMTMIVKGIPSTDPLIDFYSISFAWYGVIGSGTCLVIGIIVSLATNGWKQSYRESHRPEVMYNVADNCCRCCPLSCRQCYRCGVQFDDTHISVSKNQVAPLDDDVEYDDYSLDDEKQQNNNTITTIAT